MFSIESHSKDDHDIEVTVFDVNNSIIFDELYSINSNETIYSPVVTTTLGSYNYVVTMDNSITKEQNVNVEYSTNVGSSDRLAIEIYDEDYECNDEVLVLSVSIA